MAQLELIEIDGPAHWASALVNGDFSGLTPEEATRVQRWRKKALPSDASFAGIRKDSERFTWAYDYLYGEDCSGGTVCTYQVLTATLG